MNISIAAEPVIHIGSQPITNSVLTASILVIVMIIAALILRLNLKKVPGKIQSSFELIYDGLFQTFAKVIGRQDVARDLFPFLIAAFLFIAFSNLSGLLPGFNTIGVREIIHGKEELVPLFRAPTSDLNMVIALALISVVYVQYLGVKYVGAKKYAGKFINFKGPINTFVGLMELLSEFTRIISYSFRLFGNIFAGEVLITVIFYITMNLLPMVPIIPLPFYFIEIFVGLIQAVVFCFLTTVFAAIAVIDHDEHAESTKLAASKH